MSVESPNKQYPDIPRWLKSGDLKINDQIDYPICCKLEDKKYYLNSFGCIRPLTYNKGTYVYLKFFEEGSNNKILSSKEFAVMHALFNKSISDIDNKTTYLNSSYKLCCILNENTFPAIDTYEENEEIFFRLWLVNMGNTLDSNSYLSIVIDKFKK